MKQAYFELLACRKLGFLAHIEALRLDGLLCPNCDGTGQGNPGQEKDLCDVCLGKKAIN